MRTNVEVCSSLSKFLVFKYLLMIAFDENKLMYVTWIRDLSPIGCPVHDAVRNKFVS